MTTIATKNSIGHSAQGGFLEGLRLWFAQYRVYRQTRAELSALSDRELSDIGVSRSEITSIATSAAAELVR